MSTPPTAPTQGAAQDLTDEKIEALRLHIVNEDCVCDYEQDVLRLLAEVKRRRVLDVAATQARMEQHIEEERAAERRGWLAGREAAADRLRAHPLIAETIRALVPPAAEPLAPPVAPAGQQPTPPSTASLPAQPTAANPTAEPERKP